MSYRLDIFYFNVYVLLHKQKEHLKSGRGQYKQLVWDSMAFLICQKFYKLEQKGHVFTSFMFAAQTIKHLYALLLYWTLNVKLSEKTQK